MTAIVFARIDVKEEDLAAIERHAHRMGATVQQILESAFREGVEILLERIEEAELPPNGHDD